MNHLIFNFTTDERPAKDNLHIGQELKIEHLIEREAGADTTLTIVVDEVIPYPASTEIQGYCTFNHRRHRATAILNQHQAALDSVTLIYHP